MKILVTGGAGFIGSHLIKRLLKLGYEVVGVDNFDPYYNPKLKEKNITEIEKRDEKKKGKEEKKFCLYREDILNLAETEQIFKKEKPDKICHLAAKVGVRPSIANPLIYEQVNIRGTINLLELAKKFAVMNFVFASSSSVYGNNQKIPFSEDDKVDFPISPYAATKRAGELIAYTYHHLYGLNCTGLRFFTVYGPSGRPDMAPFLFTDRIWKGKEIEKFGDGISKRDYTFIDDIICGIVAAIEKGLPFEIINLGNNHPVELNYFSSLIQNLLGKKARIKEFPEQPGDVEITCADISKAGKLLNFQPKIPFEEGMKKFINWYLENQRLLN